MGGPSWQTGGAVVYIFVYNKSVSLGGSCHEILELLSSARVVDSSHQFPFVLVCQQQFAWATVALFRFLRHYNCTVLISLYDYNL